MNLQILSTDESLINLLKGSGLFKQVINIQDIENASEEYVLISDSIVDYQKLSVIDFQNKSQYFYMLSHSYDPSLEKTVKAICDSKNIVLIPSRLVEDQILDLIESTINPLNDKSSNVFTFFATIGNVGTTATCLSVGSALSKHTNAKIGILLLNAWDDGTDQIDYKGSYLNEIKGKLSSQIIQNDNEFLSLFHMTNKDSLYILGGNKNIRMERLFTIEEIHYLIQKSKEVFDIVLIDSGNHFDNAIMVQALVESDLRFLVVNQQTKALKKFNYIFNDVLYPLGYKSSDFLMIINRYQDKMHLPTAKDINKEINVPMITTIQENEYGLVSEQEQKLLYSYDDGVYHEAIKLIAKTISAKANIDYIQLEEKKKKRLFGK